MRLQAKVSLITGAGQGIGKAIALAFAREGSRVVVNDINLETARDTAQEIKDMKLEKVKALPIRADISKKDEVSSMLQEILRNFGRIDILVNNAGVQTETPFLDLSEQEWDRIMAVNLKGAFLCSQLAAREMVKQKTGKIINISSVHQFLPRSNIAHYAASKGGMMMLTKVMAIELAEYKINVNCIAPGAVATAMNEAVLSSPPSLAELNSHIPWGRMAEPEEIAQCAVYLASDDANYITGSTIYIDGGLTLGQLKAGK
jgi:glucose 1-dehydrogenase